MDQALRKATDRVDRAEDFGERHVVSLREIPRQGCGLDLLLLWGGEFDMAGRRDLHMEVLALGDVGVRSDKLRIQRLLQDGKYRTWICEPSHARLGQEVLTISGPFLRADHIAVQRPIFVRLRQVHAARLDRLGDMLKEHDLVE